MPTKPAKPREGFLGNAGRGVANSWRNFWNRQATGMRNATPGQSGFNWRQLADVVTEPFVPGNFYNSQGATGGNWQVPGTDTVQRGAGWLGSLFNRDRTPTRPPGGALPGWMQPGAPMPAQQPWNGVMLPNYTDPNAVGPDPNTGLYGEGQGVFRSPAPTERPGGGGRPGMDTFTLMREAPGWASFVAHYNAMMAPRNRMK